MCVCGARARAHAYVCACACACWEGRGVVSSIYFLKYCGNIIF